VLLNIREVPGSDFNTEICNLDSFSWFSSVLLYCPDIGTSSVLGPTYSALPDDEDRIQSTKRRFFYLTGTMDNVRKVCHFKNNYS
jgi:hypothetical protein